MIDRALMNGTYSGPFHFTNDGSPLYPRIAVDPITGDVYWADRSEGSIIFYNSTTGESHKLIPTGNNALVHISVLDGYIYWADGTCSVKRAQLLGNGQVRSDSTEELDTLLTEDWPCATGSLVAVNRDAQLGECTMRLLAYMCHFAVLFA